MSLKPIFFGLVFVFAILAIFSAGVGDARFPSSGPNVGFAASSGLCVVAAAIADLAEKISKDK